VTSNRLEEHGSARHAMRLLHARIARYASCYPWTPSRNIDARHPRGGPHMPETTSIQWQHDADAALEEARRTNRPVLIYFSAAPS